MTSKKQVEANRANSSKSTGPITRIGKDTSRKNAIKHGLTARTIVLKEEDAAEFGFLVEQLMGELGARNTLERQLVQSLAESFWRLRRAPVFEAKAICALRAQTPAKELQTREEIFRKHLEEIAKRYAEAAQRLLPASEQRSEKTTVGSKEAPEDQGKLFQKQTGLMFINNDNLSNLLTSLDRHETTLLNTTVRTLGLLFSLVKRRKGSKRDSPANTKSVAALRRLELMVVPGEDPAELLKLCTALQKDHEPKTLLESELVGYIAGLLWRLARVPVFERAIIEAFQREFAPPKPDGDHLAELVERWNRTLGREPLSSANQPKKFAAPPV